MKSLWDENEAKIYKTDMEVRVYSSRLLGQDSSLVLHGGGNTSVKSTASNLFGESENILYVKGSGWDLATIEAEGFAPVKMDMLLKMAKLDKLSDTDMVKYQRLAMINPLAPNPSVEAILHAIIPFKFVDHTHADAIVTITNTQDAEKKIKEIYGEKILIIPYIMPGFVLAKLIYEMTKKVNWSKLEGLVLMNHGLFTFNDDAKKSYEKTIELVSMAEQYLLKQGCDTILRTAKSQKKDIDILTLAKIRKEVSHLKGHATVCIFNDSKIAYTFANDDVKCIATQGPLTPDHVIRTKRVPALLGDNFIDDLNQYITDYKTYFLENKTDEIMLNPAPNFAILKGFGSISFGKNYKEASIIKDINEHTFEAILKAQKLGGYKALSKKEIFNVEYWSLEQAKLKKSSSNVRLMGKVAVIVGGFGKLCLRIKKKLQDDGCNVILLDENQTITNIVKTFGGIDIVINTFSKETKILDEFKPFLELGIDSCVVNILNQGEDNYLLCKVSVFDEKELKIEVHYKNVADLVSTFVKF